MTLIKSIWLHLSDACVKRILLLRFVSTLIRFILINPARTNQAKSKEASHLHIQ